MLVLVLGACRSAVPGPPGPSATGTNPSTDPWTTGWNATGGQSGEDPAYGSCGTTSTVVGADEVVDGPDGPYDAADLIALAEGTHDLVLTWLDDGSVTAATVDLAWDGEIRRVDPVAGPSTSTDYCLSWLEVDGGFALDSADGRLEAAGGAVLAGSSPTRAYFTGDWEDGADLRTVGALVTASDDPPQAWLSGSIQQHEPLSVVASFRSAGAP